MRKNIASSTWQHISWHKQKYHRSSLIELSYARMFMVATSDLTDPVLASLLVIFIVLSSSLLMCEED